MGSQRTPNLMLERRHEAGIVTLTRFLEHLEAQGIVLAHYEDERGDRELVREHVTNTDLVCRYLGIDPQALAAERTDLAQRLGRARAA